MNPASVYKLIHIVKVLQIMEYPIRNVRTGLLLLMIDFNGMSTSLKLFYAPRLGNRVQCTLIFEFCIIVSKGILFAHSHIEYEYISYTSI